MKLQRWLSIFLLLISISYSVSGASDATLTQPLIPLDQVFTVITEDIARIEPFYPKQFKRLEMNWLSNVKKYKRLFKSAKTLEEKIDVLSRYVNSWHNAHHRPLSVNGLRRETSQKQVSLPIKIFAQGIKLSKAKFFVLDVDSNVLSTKGIQIGDEIKEYNGRKMKDHILWVRDQFRYESPEMILNSIAHSMTEQTSCTWGQRNCWDKGDKTSFILSTSGKSSNKKLLTWQDDTVLEFQKQSQVPVFAPESSKWKFKTLYGQYGYEYDDVSNVGFFGELSDGKNIYLVYKQFFFMDKDLIDHFLKIVYDKKYKGIIFDFQENYGGDDTAFTLLAGILGDQFHLELSSMNLVPELKNQKLMRDSAVYESNIEFFTKLLDVPSNYNKMSPFIPFQCLDETCEPKTIYKNYIDKFPKPLTIPSGPLKNMALITGRATVSKSDSINVLFHAHKLGPVIGTPAMASSGRYYFKKEYYVPIGDNVITLGVTYTPDFSLAGNCKEVQGNPPMPHSILERTIENYHHYDTTLWIEATKAIKKWDYSTRNLERQCSISQAESILKRFKLTKVK